MVSFLWHWDYILKAWRSRCRQYSTSYVEEPMEKVGFKLGYDGRKEAEWERKGDF